MNQNQMLDSVKHFLEDADYSYDSSHILEAMTKIDRAFFADNKSAYLDTALPIGQGQTISQPSTVARMLMLAKVKKGDKVLEIGAGSGWNACLLGYIVKPGEILSVDISEKLVENAKIQKTYSKDFYSFVPLLT